MGLGLDPPGAATLRRVVTGGIACISYAVRLCRAAAFWGTILLPPVIVGGLATDLATSAPVRLPALVALNVLCILLGRSYRSDE